YLVIHRRFKAFSEARPRLDRVLQSIPGSAVRMAFTLLCVCIGWVFFRAQTFTAAGAVFPQVFLPHQGLGPPLRGGRPWYTVAVVAICHLVAQRGVWKKAAEYAPAPVLGFGYAAVLTLALVLAPDSGKAFIYFQF